MEKLNFKDYKAVIFENGEPVLKGSIDDDNHGDIIS